MPGHGGLTELANAAFAVNPSPLEFDLARTYPASDTQTEGKENIYEAVKGQLPVWSYLLLLGVILLLLEGVMAGWGLRKSHLKGSSQ